jgi:hypothetical protein
MGRKIRPFTGTHKGEEFTVKTKMTDAEAIEALRETGNKFNLDCADHIELLALSETNPRVGRMVKANMVAWGFRKAEALANAPGPTCLSKAILKVVKFKRPFKDVLDDGQAVRVSLGGPDSKNAGRYIITDPTRAFRAPGSFFGFAEPDGSWTPRDDCPASIIDALTK